MADKKISALTSLAQGDVAVSTDVLPIVDTSATETKKVTAAALVGAGLTAGVTSVDINSGAIDGTTIGASSAAAGTFTNLTASGTVSFSGATVSNGGSVTTVDINGGTIDGATIATSDITVGTGKTLNVSAGTLTLADNQISGDKVEGGTINAITINTLTSTAVNATTVDATNVEVTNVKAKDGTASIAIADSTGIVTVTAAPVVSALTASQAVFTTSGKALVSNAITGSGNVVMSASPTLTGTIDAAAQTLSGNLTLNGGTANGVLYLNGSKVATSGSALTFDGTKLSTSTFAAGSTTDSTLVSRLTNEDFQLYAANGLATSASGVVKATIGLYYDNNIANLNGGIQFTRGGTGTDGWMNFIAAGSEQMRLTSTGLGIGTSSPATKAEIGGVLKVWTGGTGGLGTIALGDNGTTTYNCGIYRGAAASVSSAGNFLNVGGYDGIVFTASNAAFGSQTERMRITSAGDVGIGTSSPGQKLSVATASGNCYVDVARASKSAGQVALQLSGGTSGTNWIIYQPTNSDNLTFFGNSADRMVLDSSGNLGLGVTPSAASIKTFEIGIVGNTLNGIGGGDIALMSNAYYNSGFKYAGSNLAASYRLQDGIHKWNIAASGTAGNTISFTQAMTLDASGNLGVGTTSPGAKLHLGGNTASAYQAILATGNDDSNFKVVVQNGVSGTSAVQGYIGLDYANGTWPLLAGIQFIRASTSGVLAFTTGTTTTATERARITSGGYFKASNDGTYAGSTASYHELRTNATNDLAARMTNSASSNPYGIAIEFPAAAPNDATRYFVKCEDSSALRAVIRSNGGLANYQSNNADLSDARTKKDINPIASMWDKIGALEIVTYKYNDQTHDDVNVGVIAQQVEAVEPVWVDNDGFGETPEGEEPLKTVYTKDITFAAIKALQEAMARIEKLEAEVAALKGA